MKIIYEQGDIVFNKNNFNYGIVLAEYDNVPKIIELGEETFINNVPKCALQYKGHIDITKALKKAVDEVRRGCYEETEQEEAENLLEQRKNEWLRKEGKQQIEETFENNKSRIADI